MAPKQDKAAKAARKMPAAKESKNADGTVDLAKAEAGMNTWAEAFKSGEYLLKDMADGECWDNRKALRQLGVEVEEGDEFFVVVRRKA